MKYPYIRYFQDTDTLSIDLAPGPGEDAEEVSEGVIATFDKKGRMISLEFLNDVAADYPELVAAAREGRAA